MPKVNRQAQVRSGLTQRKRPAQDMPTLHDPLSVRELESQPARVVPFGVRVCKAATQACPSCQVRCVAPSPRTETSFRPWALAILHPRWCHGEGVIVPPFLLPRSAPLGGAARETQRRAAAPGRLPGPGPGPGASQGLLGLPFLSLVAPHCTWLCPIPMAPQMELTREGLPSPQPLLSLT